MSATTDDITADFAGIEAGIAASENISDDLHTLVESIDGGDKQHCPKLIFTQPFPGVLMANSGVFVFDFINREITSVLVELLHSSLQSKDAAIKLKATFLFAHQNGLKFVMFKEHTPAYRASFDLNAF